MLNRVTKPGIACVIAGLALAGSGCGKKEAVATPSATPPPALAPNPAPSAPGVVGDPRSNVATPDMIAKMAKERKQ